MKISLGKLSAWFAIVGASGIFMWVPWLIYKSITDDSSYDFLMFFSMMVGVLLSIVHHFLAFFVKCPNCGKSLMVRGFKKIKPETHDSGLEVAFLWFTDKVHCMHCGVKVDKCGI